MTRLFSILTLCAAVAFAGCKKSNGEPTLYTITVGSGDNGEASADMKTAAAGTTVTLTATAASYCEFVKWTVGSGGVELSSLTAATATFTMPAANVSVQAEFIVRGVLINGTVWALCNVDAPGTFAAKPESAGMLYQWNRKTGWSSSDPLINSAGGETWDTTSAEGNKWETANDPCPEGWRVPTRDEQIALCNDDKTIISDWTALNGVNGHWFIDKNSENSVFLPAAGLRTFDIGARGNVGQFGLYWSATASTSAYYLYFNSDDGVNLSGINNRANCFTVRCVAAL